MNETANIVRGLTLQKQPTPVTCSHTCLAMALGVPVSEVIEHYGGEPLNQELLTKALTECGVLWNQFTIGTMIFEGWYFAVTPSLNVPGANHQILVNWSSVNGLAVMDPSPLKSYSEDGSDLKGWECLTPFIPGGKLPTRK